jgi:hypothetical protein
MLAAVLGACGGPAIDVPEGTPSPGAPAAEAHTAARPAGVPEEFVFTPNGYFHPSCVIQLAHDEHVRPDGSIARADGSTRALPGCAHPRYDKRGSVVPRETTPRTAQAEYKPFTHQWVAWAGNSAHGNLKSIQAKWTVPDYPLDPIDQTYFYFPGIEDSHAILQPVLQFNQTGFPGYTMSSWFCCLSGYTWQSPTVSVNVGDTLFGTVVGSACTEQLGCGLWTITTNDLTAGTSTQLSALYPSPGLQDAFGGVLEAYNITTCLDYSLTHSVKFSDISVETAGGAHPSITWLPGTTGASPQCGYKASSTGTNNVTITASDGLP